jgi:hypothetical protein
MIEEEQEEEDDNIGISTNKKERNDWKGEIMIAIPKILEYIKRQGRRAPSLRGLYYILLDKGLIKQKSDEHYRTLSDNCTQARLDPDYTYKDKPERKKGEPAAYLLELDALRDESRPTYQDVPTQTPQEFVEQEIIDRIKHPEKYYIPNRWEKQKHFVIVVIEKAALFDDFMTIIEQEDLQVMLFALGGYYGTTDMSDLYDILTSHQVKLGQKVHILYFGDYDGHGRVIDRNVPEKLRAIARRYLSEFKTGWYLATSTKYVNPTGGNYTPLPVQEQDFSFERLAVTIPQIKKHRLQVLKPRFFKTAEEVIRFFTKGKKKDFAKKDFALEHKQGDYYTYFEVEVDGIVSSRWEIVKKLLKDNVLKFWDEQIYESVKGELSLDKVRQQIDSKVKLLDND